MLRTKVLVVGGGPSGSTAARLLSGEGIDTILVERNFSFVKPCGGGVPSSAFDELGIPRTAIKKEIRKIRIVPPRGDEVGIELKGGFIALVKRGEFDSALRGEAEKKGTRLLEAEFISFEKKGSQVISKIRTAENEEYITADYLVASDGVNSRVRLSAGLGPVDSMYAVSERIAGATIDACEFWFGREHAPRAYSWVFPACGGVSVGTGGHDPRALRGLSKRFLEIRGLESGSHSRMYRIPLWRGEVYNKNNIFFTGDAAGQVMPLTYEGIYYGMKAGEFAARAIMCGKPSDYKRLWKRRFNSRFLIMTRLCDYFLKDDASAEKMVSIFRRRELQDLSMRLWLEKSSGRGLLLSFIKFFKRFIS